MKKILPITLFVVYCLLSTIAPAFAASPNPSATASPTPTVSASPNASGPPAPTTPVVGSTPISTGCIKVGDWECDAEVTFVGKLARRSLDTLDNVIHSYRWFDPGTQDKSKGDPLQILWVYIRNVVYAIVGLFILAAAFIIIYTKGENITVRKFIPRFIAIIILVTLSYSIVRMIYDMTDLIQFFFLRLPTGDLITSKNLLSVSFDYQNFIGLRNRGMLNDEAATIGIVLTKLTAATYFVMVALLIIRKVILWFFILVSPVFPLLIFFSPLRNTAKIWVGEFFRWTLYAPLFAIFLRGLVEIWTRYIPQNFDFQKVGSEVGTEIYPTAINILLGGPGQTVAMKNNLNVPSTFVQYVVALLMLWMVVIMPFILLRIFLSYWNNFAMGEGGLAKYLLRATPPKEPPSGPRPTSIPQTFKHPPQPPIIPPSGDTGLARSIFEEVQRTIGMPNQVSEQQRSEVAESIANRVQTSVQSGVRDTANITSDIANLTSGQLIYSAPIQQTPELQNAINQILTMTSLNIPTIKDISRYETAMLSKNPNQQAEVNKLAEAINKIAGKAPITNATEQSKVTQIRQHLVTESQKGNSVASSVLKAAGPVGSNPLPEQNDVQQVSSEDYEDVKKTWEQNYGTIEPPAGPDGKPQDRKEWLNKEQSNITIVIQLLQSEDKEKQKEGMDKVSQILPFLLLGGFSRNEIITYLKAKLEAAKNVLAQATQKKEDEDTMVEVDRKQEEKPKAMQFADELPRDEDKSNPNDAQKRLDEQSAGLSPSTGSDNEAPPSPSKDEF